jgi:hypothetical protein
MNSKKRELKEIKRVMSAQVGHGFYGNLSLSHGLVLYGDSVAGGRQGTGLNGIVVPVNGDPHIRALVGVL